MVKRILVGIDFSESSRAALARAAGWAREWHVPLTAIHVIEESPAASRPYVGMGDPAWFQAQEPGALEHLKTWLEPHAGATALVRRGRPAGILVDEADPDTLLVVGQVGHGRLSDMLFGSTTSRVVRHAPCDVLVVRGVG